MMCLANICSGDSQNKQAEEIKRLREARAKELREQGIELRSQVNTLEAKLEMCKAEVESARAIRERKEAETQLKEEKKIELQAQLKAMETLETKKKELERLSQKNDCACLDFFSASNQEKEKALKAELQKVTNNLKACEKKARQTREQVETLEKSLQVEKLVHKSFQEDLALSSRSSSRRGSKDSSERTPTPPTVAAAERKPQKRPSFNSSFMKDLSTFRQKTPDEQIAMRGMIRELLSDLQRTQDELTEEQELLDEFATKGGEIDKTIKELEPQVGNGLFVELRGKRNQAWFRAQTPACQRQIKDELTGILQQLETTEVESLKNRIRAESMTKKVSRMRDRTEKLEKKLSITSSTSQSFQFKQ